MKFTHLVITLFLLSASCTRAQQGESWKPNRPRAYSFVHPAQNRISNPAALNPLFGRLYRLHHLQEQGKATFADNVCIVHIGDSHIQADMLTGVVRQAFQEFFGNAGRGLVFPYQVAKSNAPSDVASSSNVSWQANRLAHPEIPITCGLSGFGIHTNARGARLKLELKGDSSATWFDQVRLFTDTDRHCFQLYLAPDTLPFVTPRVYSSAPVFLFRPGTALTLSQCPDTYPTAFNLYGISLERAHTIGMRYHTIGVNGAQYFQYNNTPLFWQQLPALKADCYIISMGTNEAQAFRLKRDSFMLQCRLMIRKLRTASPDAVILLTTPAGSYTHAGKPNAVLGAVAEALKAVCDEEGLACWDLYGITGGYAGAAGWQRSGLMSKDLVHYNADGYGLQARLLLQALSAAYNDYLKAENK